MEVYVLDSLLRRTQVVDQFESLIWTERFQEVGDFELDLVSTPRNRALFRAGTQLAMNESYRVMTVKTVEDRTDEEGREMLKVVGDSLEQILDDRVVKDATISPFSEWYLLGTPGNIAREMFDRSCRDGVLDLKDKIPFLMPGSIFPEDTIPETDTPILWAQAPDSLLKAEKDICQAYDLGFRLVRNFDLSQLYFDIYSGSDRTSRQSELKPVIFSVSLDSIQNTTEYSTIAGAKNVAYVYTNVGSVQQYEVVYGENVDPDISGFERRVLYINASDINTDGSADDISTQLIQKGVEALQGARALELFDGEINQYNPYKYGIDYQLGDLVELRNKDGIVTYKRVTEQIFVSDSEGDRSYPTLAIDLFAGANTWLSWDSKPTVWSDFDTEFWSEM